MNEKVSSVVATLVLVAALAALLLRHALLAGHPIAAVVQIAAALLMVWARTTFGRRSFHAAANPTEGGSTWRTRRGRSGSCRG